MNSYLAVFFAPLFDADLDIVFLAISFPPFCMKTFGIR